MAYVTALTLSYKHFTFVSQNKHFTLLSIIFHQWVSTWRNQSFLKGNLLSEYEHCSWQCIVCGSHGNVYSYPWGFKWYCCCTGMAQQCACQDTIWWCAPLPQYWLCKGKLCGFVSSRQQFVEYTYIALADHVVSQSRRSQCNKTNLFTVVHVGMCTISNKMIGYWYRYLETGSIFEPYWYRDTDTLKTKYFSIFYSVQFIFSNIIQPKCWLFFFWLTVQGP